MKDQCEAEVDFTLSKLISGKQISEFLEELKEGYPGIETFEFKTKGEKIIIKLGLNRRTITECLAYFKKSLERFLGKEFKAGIRKITVRDYKIKFRIPRSPKEPFEIPWVDELKFEEGSAILFYKELDESFIFNNRVERTIKLVQEKIERQYYEGKEEYWELIEKSKPKKITYCKDPSAEMLKKGWIVKAPGKGKWIYMPEFVSVMRAMEQIVFEKILEPLNFKEVIGSMLISGEEVWIRTGHLEGVPMEIYYVAEPISRDPKKWERFVDKIKIARKIDYDEFKGLINFRPLKGLTYAQCPILYYAFKGKTIAEASLPVKIFDRTQVSFRYEAGGKHGVERTDEFHRIELVFIGKKEQLLELRKKLISAYKTIFDEILELEWRMAWVTPFYLQQSGEIGKEEGERERIKGTIDFEAYLPYKNEWLEIQNLTIAGDKYTKAFNIKAQKGELWSGCSGIGLERWCVAFLSQHSLNQKEWPKKFREYLKELPEGFRFC